MPCRSDLIHALPSLNRNWIPQYFSAQDHADRPLYVHPIAGTNCWIPEMHYCWHFHICLHARGFWLWSYINKYNNFIICHILNEDEERIFLEPDHVSFDSVITSTENQSRKLQQTYPPHIISGKSKAPCVNIPFKDLVTTLGVYVFRLWLVPKTRMPCRIQSCFLEFKSIQLPSSAFCYSNWISNHKTKQLYK